MSLKIIYVIMQERLQNDFYMKSFFFFLKISVNIENGGGIVPPKVHNGYLLILELRMILFLVLFI